MSTSTRPWRLWIDTGGTFTDCLAVDPGGKLHSAKVLSSGAVRGSIENFDGRRVELARSVEVESLPDGFFSGCSLGGLDQHRDPTPIESSIGRTLILREEWRGQPVGVEIRFREKAPVVAARLVTRTPAGAPLPRSEVRFATTRGTNALLERSGTPPALVATRGFSDLLAIGNQQRPEIFALRIEKRAPLYGLVIEANERVGFDGSVERGLDRELLAAAAEEAVAGGFRTAAVAFLNAYRNPVHELEAARILREVGFDHVSTSADLSPRIKIVPRAEATVIDAYLARVVGDYLRELEKELRTRELFVMTSLGGLARSSEYRAKDSLLSGPAGGVVGAARGAGNSGVSRILAFDMGGTSTDVARHDGRFEYRSETVVGSARLASPSLAVETVAAGGGSICKFDGRQLKVGPESAGADPGPACYGRGGPLTLTDVNLLLGRLLEDHFAFKVDRAAAESRARDIWSEDCRVGGTAAFEELLEGLLAIANETMAGAVRRISLRSGYRPSDYTLVAFGGAGPQHACALANLLGIGRVLVPSSASLLSAFGLGHSRLERFAELQVLEELMAANGTLGSRFEELRKEAFAALARDGVRTGSAEVERREAFVRFVGQDTALALDWSPDVDLEGAFGDAYESHYGYRPRGMSLEIESLRLIAVGPEPESMLAAESRPAGTEARSGGSAVVHYRGVWLEGPVFDRGRLALGEEICGPAWVVEEHTVTPVDPGWTVRSDAAGALVLEKR